VQVLNRSTGSLCSDETSRKGVFGETEDIAIANPIIFVLSASEQPALTRNSNALSAHLNSLPYAQNSRAQTDYLANLAYTLATKRTRLRWIRFYIADSMQELQRKLHEDSALSFRAGASEYRIGFIFTGQGAQWSQMGSALMAYPVFRQSVVDAASYLIQLGSPWDMQCKHSHAHRYSPPIDLTE
jgi:zearalenone synthase (highly reducing iterative type I polyketide synthase)